MASIQESLKSEHQPRTLLYLAFAFCLYLLWVVFTSSYHEVWRDEVRALSLVHQAADLPDLFTVLKNEGHPALWYLILFVGTKLTSSSIVLKVASITIAGAAVFLLLFFSPFQWWLRILLAFGLFPVYEYSVMCRNYGISMLLMFIFCILYQRWRERPFAAAFTLFLLANTNAHSVVLVFAVIACMAFEEVFLAERVGGKDFVLYRLLPLLTVIAGMCASAITAMPDADSIVTNVAGTTPGQVVSQLLNSFIKPGSGLPEIFWPVPAPFSGICFVLACIPLLLTPSLLVLLVAGTIGLSTFFGVVYEGQLRHQGIFWILLVSAYWLKAYSPLISNAALTRFLEAEPVRRLSILLAVVFLAVGVGRGAYCTAFDLKYELSSSKTLVHFIQQDESLKNAILVGEPDYALEAVPYYTKNRLYLPREKRFASYAHFTKANAQKLTRAELLQEALMIRRKYQVPVLIVFGHFGLDGNASFMTEDVTGANSGLRSLTTGYRLFSYGKTFTWDATDDPALLQSVEKVTEFMSGASENFELYRVR